MEIYDTLDKSYIKYGNMRINVIIDKDDNLWFGAKSTARALGYKNLKDAIVKNVRSRDKRQLRHLEYVKGPKEHPQTLYITEAGLYKLMLRSRMPTAEDFTEWITHDVLPSIRKYGKYVLKKELNILMKKFNYLKNENEKMKNDLKKETFPEGALVYVVDYTDEEENTYRIGMTINLNTRKQIYNTHMLHKRRIVFKQEVSNPIQLETCVRAMLYDYRYRDRKDFYVCPFSKIKAAFATCNKSINYVRQKKESEKQKGGSNKTKKQRSKQEGGSGNIMRAIMAKTKQKEERIIKKIKAIDNILKKKIIEV